MTEQGDGVADVSTAVRVDVTTHKRWIVAAKGLDLEVIDTTLGDRSRRRVGRQEPHLHVGGRRDELTDGEFERAPHTCLVRERRDVRERATAVV